MKLIFKIAKNEFRYLFYSPIAWFLLIVFLVMCGVFFTDYILNNALTQDMVLRNKPNYKFQGDEYGLTTSIFFKSGIFQNALRNLYLFIPLLTMGLISREANNGTIKLLYSSPASSRHIVFGKYLGIMLYNLLLVLIVVIFIVTGIFIIKNVDYGPLLSAILGFYLLVCAYSAIGMFMSSLTTYQMVSALSCFAIIFILSRIDGLWQRYDFVRDLTYFLSLQNRTGKMLSGLITTKDVIYFIAISCMFIGFTLIKLKNDREAKPWYVKKSRYIAILAATLLIGYISSRPILTGYWDTTATKRNTIHPRTQRILKELGDSTLEVTLYTNLFSKGLAYGLPEARNAAYMAVMWEPYLRFKPDIKFKYEYYYDTDVKGTDSALYKFFKNKNLRQIAEEHADAGDIDLSKFKSPEQMHKTIDLQPENYQVVMQLKYRGHTAFLRTYPPPDPFFWPTEINLNAVLKRLLGAGIPKVYFVSGELERNIYKTDDREYAGSTTLKLSRGTLVNVGFDVDTLNLSTQSIPANANILVLADPKMDLSPTVQNKLKNYIDGGGNMLITGEPGKQYVLNPFLQQLGVQLMPGQLVEPTYDETPEKVRPYLAAISANLAEEPNLLSLKNKTPSNAHDDTIINAMPGVAALSYKEDSVFAIKPLAMTVPNKAWLKAGNLIVDSTLPAFNPQEGDIKQSSFPTAVQLTRTLNNKEQRIIVCGDADFMSNGASENAIGYAFYSWMAYNQFPIYTPHPLPKDTSLLITAAGAAMQKTVYVWVLPGVILLLGTVLLIRRKRK